LPSIYTGSPIVIWCRLKNRLGVEMIVELGSVAALAVFGYTIFWFVRRRRDITRTALRELIKQMNKNKREQ
jgi:hypothetical protein